MRRTTRHAFTLIELLVVVSIIGLLIAIILPSLARAREEAKLVKCGTNLRAIGVAFATYAQQNQDFMPASDNWKKVSISDTMGDYALGNRDRGWFSPPMQYLDLSWPESLYIDGDLALGCGNKGGSMVDHLPGEDPAVGANWSNPISFEPLFVCPKRPEDQRKGDGPTKWGYGMSWCATSSFLPILAWNGTLIRPACPVRAATLTAHHIVAADGEVYMGRDAGYGAPATDDNGVAQRHKRGQSKGANYLMADCSVTWSDKFANDPSPLNFSTDYTNAQRSAAARNGNIWAHGTGAQR